MSGWNVMPDAVEVRTECLVVKKPGGGGSARIPWSEITSAALALKDRQIEVELPTPKQVASASWLGSQFTEAALAQSLEQARSFRESHDVLWIFSQHRQIRVILERTGAEREALLRMLGERLGPRWLGDQFTSVELAQRFGYQPQSRAPMYFALSVVALVVILAATLRLFQVTEFVRGLIGR